MSVSEDKLSPTDETAISLGKALCFLIALAYGGLLASLPVLGFLDRANYLAYASDSFVLFAKYLSTGLLSALSNAPLWLLLNGSLGLVLRPAELLRLIIFVQAAAVAYLLLRAGRKSWLWIIVLLFMPPFVNNYTTHLRQGMGIAVFLLGWFSTGRVKRWFLIGASPFIHESFAFVVVLYVMTEAMKKLRLAVDVKTVAIMFFSVVLSLGLVAIAKFVGARQVTEYSVTSTAVSGASFFVWLIVLCLLLLERGELNRHYDIAVAAVTFYLGAYFLIKVSDRIFESTFPLVFLCGLRLTGWRRIVFLWAMVSVAISDWALAIGSPSGHIF